ncbi:MULTISPECIES: formimidoylglutamate deiminase [unclassified Sulfitobacter]|jgi:formimidoylglutamate deiminase|uniref:formimidoylglutamate deiminase n=1 Tax=unclassified Sulfitobacter TaxID=196795 RepID=UPI0007C23F3E|nr:MULTISPECIES: formimidoylglutamate deiminase [unclassified Sulfitobacter]KZX93765.1 formimidoylglutamate deiminase [Sulfitobacter sp. HI0023]KZY27451.1 formimidoylglutamate deiminase [Sulfitobacter sp. HI0040]KZZ70098.1 formimidoylglutamate deiminase [Sulfitobacter sp. HI0129]
MRILAKQALLATGWAEDVRVSLFDGCISAITVGVEKGPEDVSVGTLLPAMSNLHSHSFQRAMAGMTERRQPGKDSFWTWRDLMYRFTRHLTPDHIEAIAAQVFVEMQEAGYAGVGEFHYLHHGPDGAPYAEIAELSGRICAAAERTGIGLTLLPVLYTYGGAGRVALSEGQRRFGNDVDRFLNLHVAAGDIVAQTSFDARIGVAPHSLRATAPEDLQKLIAALPEGPLHIHAAEQPKEVRDVTDWLGARPVEWLLHEVGADDRWCLIHATHMTQAETEGLAKSGAVAGLCPITEANLGDGPFNGPAFLEAGGLFGIGSDSNVRISLCEELRMLEYSQRLRDLSRNVMVRGQGSVGDCLYRTAAEGGARALGRNAGSIAEGRLADLVAIDGDHPALCALSADQLLDGLAFAASDNVVTDLWSAGRHCVSEGRHIARDAVAQAYRGAMADLTALL